MYKVIEIGCFSCADLYGNDLNKVVEAVSTVAVRKWKNIIIKYNMGLGIGISKSSFDAIRTVYDEKIVYKDSPNPDPSRYTIIKGSQIGKYLILMINYLDCVNYEGNKILVFECCTLKDLKKQKKIDPHFSNSYKYHSPIARFEPTNRGWWMAEKFVKMLTS